MKIKPMKSPHSQTEVLAWLLANYPALHAAVEIERDWLWLSYDLRGAHQQAVRDALVAFGFRYAKRGHLLPSGKLSFWGHSCTRPIPFQRRGKTNKAGPPTQSDNGAWFSPAELAEAAALFT